MSCTICKNYKTHNITMCKFCTSGTCLICAIKWQKTNQSCPYCRNYWQLPNKLPNLVEEFEETLSSIIRNR